MLKELSLFIESKIHFVFQNYYIKKRSSSDSDSESDSESEFDDYEDDENQETKNG